ncbi:helix-turn-helix transcriptional regulator [Streptomyces caniscabiei]|uniref:helix-turn-helix transcriptional regulator n=1 Tax=Streptomyces caniscabiei TaxID=2746961 RepID=UPI0029AE1D1B|nr:helix-turn-helix transcriptional regulator [Streptomyces caniscabiei]MDX3507333.1 helix-turn-helix transcriptional regulator [Streptomyces caniscabiei]
MSLPQTPEVWVHLGSRIRAERERQGMSRKVLAERAQVSPGSVQSAEKGLVPKGRWPQTLSAIENALGWAPGSMRSVLNGGEIEYQPSLFDNSTIPAGGANYEAEVTVPDYGRLGSHEIELVQSGHLAQDVFMRQAKRYRKLQGLSIEQIAEKLAGREPILEDKDIRRLEEGTRLLRVAEAKAIAFALDTTVDWLLGSGFDSDVPDEMKWPPNDEELQAEAKAVERRMGEVGAQVVAARAQYASARQREEEARQQSQMALAMYQQASAHQREMERHYQYLLGRIDSIRAAKGDELIIQMHPVYEDDEEAGGKPSMRPAHTPSSSHKAGAQYPGSKAQQEEMTERTARRLR